MTRRSFYVTTPIYYVNDRPHLGTAYTTIAADALARYHRAAGFDTMFLTGLDEHGQKIAQAAAAVNMAPEVFADRMAQPFEDVWKMLDISNDDFIRTTEERHAQVVQRLWREVAAKGDIYLGRYEGLYCYGCEAYFTEKDLDEKGCCPMGHGKPSQVSMPSYFFRLSKYQEPLMELYEANPGFVRPRERLNEVMSFVGEGLRDISISRTNFSWGIGVPDDPAHVVYVWFDALANYVSALGWGGTGSEGERFARYWPATYHLVGKDIIRFHAVYWPAMLMAAGIAPPGCVFAHGWLTVNRQKMGKSMRNVLDPLRLKWEYGGDMLRYYLLRDNVFGLDGDFSHDLFVARMNADLANDLGNLVSRSATLARKFLGGRVPAAGEGGEDEARLRRTALGAMEAAGRFYAEAQFHRALEATWQLCAEANRYVDAMKPWALAKTGDAARLGTVLYHCLESCRLLAHMAAPVMPRKSRQVLGTLGLPAPGMREEPAWPTRWGGLPEGVEVRQARPLFPRIDEAASAAIGERIGFAAASADDAAKTAAKEAPPSPAAAPEGLLTIDEFRKARLVVGVVLECEGIEGAKKLLKMKVDVGEPRPRSIVAGIALHYAPADMVGRRVVVVTNLVPARLRGVLSEGMLLAATSPDAALAVVTPAADLPPGSTVS